MFKQKRSMILVALVVCALLVSACSIAPVSDAAQTAEQPVAATEGTATEATVTEATITGATVTGATVTEAVTDTTVYYSENGVERPAGWTDETHSNDVDPNYEAAYPQDVVTTLRITIDPEQWQIMRDDITEILGEPSEGGMGGFGGIRPGGNFTGTFPFDPENMPEGFDPSNFPFDPENMPEGFDPSNFPFDPENMPEGFEPGNFPQGGPGGMGGGDMISETPTWVEATIEYEGNVWTHVGIRYKGNSSLRGSWNGDALKLPFKIDFDEWEDDYPEIDNQRFHGFKELSLANNFGDSSGMRDALAYDIFEAAGLPAGQTTFYNVILDYGEGQVDLGLYTSNEVVDETVISQYFGSDDGNIYEANGSAASLAEGTSGNIEASFEKKNNEDAADWSDVEELYTVLHSDLRTTDVDAWQAELEAIFNVDDFLNWLAASAVINHWDTYGQMTHNFYLYDDPATGQLNWISWDHNFTFGGSMGGGMRGRGNAAPADATAPPADVVQAAPAGFRGGMGGESATSMANLSKETVGDNWPLISELLAVPEYEEAYLDYMATVLQEGFATDELLVKIDTWAEALAPYANEELGEDAFTAAVQGVKEFVTVRAATVQEFLAAQ